MTEDQAHYRIAYLPADIARCRGIGYQREDTLGIEWRHDCERCLRRLAPIESDWTPMMQTPRTTGLCPYQIEDDQ